MKKRGLFALLGLFLFFLLSGCVDQSGSQEEEQEQEEATIVATSVVIAEILDALAIDNVIGVPHSDYFELPSAFEHLPRIGSPMAPDMEMMRYLNPDWILSPLSLEGELADGYKEAGFNVAFVNLSSLEGMHQAMIQLGEKFDREAEATVLVEQFFGFMDEHRESLEGFYSPTVLILMGLPGGLSYVVATENSYVGNLVRLAGGTNVFADEEADFITIDMEEMLLRDPDIILLTTHAMPETVEAMFERELDANNAWQHFRALEEDRVYLLPHGMFGMSANFTYPEALTYLVNLFFPDDELQDAE